MKKVNLCLWAEQLARKNNFEIGEMIYENKSMLPNRIRNVIYDGKYKGKSAVLKVYDDPWVTDEPVALELFNENNKSKLLTAPELYKYKAETPKMGWFIMEKLSEGDFLSPPLTIKEKKDFVEIYIEYRNNFPVKPERNLNFTESLPADEYHVLRLNRWLQVASDIEESGAMNGDIECFDRKEVLDMYRQGLEVVRKEFFKRKMVYCHGHLRPQEIYKYSKSRKFAIINFAHAKMYPEGYDIAFIIGEDYIFSADWKEGYEYWKKGVFSWIEEFQKAAGILKIRNYKSLIKASLTERILGIIFTEVYTISGAREEKCKRMELMKKLFYEIQKL